MGVCVCTRTGAARMTLREACASRRSLWLDDLGSPRASHSVHGPSSYTCRLVCADSQLGVEGTSCLGSHMQRVHY